MAWHHCCCSCVRSLNFPLFHCRGICFVKIEEAGRNYIDGQLYKKADFNFSNELDGNFKVDAGGKINSTLVLRYHLILHISLAVSD